MKEAVQEVVLHRENSSQRAPRVLARVQAAKNTLLSMLERGYTHWVIAFSGGKDSTAVVSISLEAALESQHPPQRIDVVYADTRLEIPTIHRFALSFLQHLRESPRLQQLPLFCHVIAPPIENRFWVLLLGQGYPPPRYRFRWCTSRLKIWPVEKELNHLIRPGQTLTITGVRFGESRSRDKRLSSSCESSGECGEGMWFRRGARRGIGYLAPMINWVPCDVWDYLLFIAPQAGYPTSELQDVYDGEQKMRFGCWMCTLVKRDQAAEKTIAKPEWSHLAPLVAFRSRVLDVTSAPESRLLQPDGRLGKLTLGTREMLLKELLVVQAEVGMRIIEDDEIRAIQYAWEEEKNSLSDLV